MTNKLILTTILLSLFSQLMWIIGLIYGNINMFIASIIILAILSIICIIKYDEMDKYFSTIRGRKIEDERTKFIDEKAATTTIGITVGALLYIAIGIITLRSTFTEYLPAAYTLILVVVLIFIINMITRQYFKNKF